ncbi:mersacidin/lichenicidin family type 2 lantibiotic [Polymorphospora sp. NPDC050346]|uniref:mersacidin/lichenicidin family type 2 lantibiotic n=1 Tax=Polymorphospora sp. NPDC050346 TaxID=3155780 RepID=UPI00341194ED
MNSTAKAWKDPLFRATLNDVELAELPAHPVGSVEFDMMGMDDHRGAATEAVGTAGCCGNAPWTQRTCLSCAWMWTCLTCWGCS